MCEPRTKKKNLSASGKTPHSVIVWRTCLFPVHGARVLYNLFFKSDNREEVRHGVTLTEHYKSGLVFINRLAFLSLSYIFLKVKQNCHDSHTN